MTISIDPHAIVEKGAELADGVTVGPFSIIGKNVTLGTGTVIGPHVVIDGFTDIGEANIISPFVSIGGPPQDLKYDGAPTRVLIGNRNTIRESTTINRATSLEHPTRVGDDNLLMAYVHIAHDCLVGNRTVLANCATLAGHVTICDHAILGGMVAAHQFVKIGRYAFIGGASAVHMDIPPFVSAVGNRVKLHGLNKTGLKRNGFTDEQITAISKTYKIVFRSSLTLDGALERINDEGLIEDPNIREFVDFLTSSVRGFAR